MPIHGMPMRGARLVVGTLVLALAASLIPFASASAAVGPATVTPATGGGALSADHAQAAPGDGGFTTLTGPSIAETVAGELSTGTIVLVAPAGFEFLNGGTGSVSLSPSTCGMMTTPWASTAAQVTMLITTVSTTACTLTFNGIQVSPTAGTPLATGNIKLDPTSSSDPPGGTTNYGTLTEIAGAPVLTFTVQPSVSNTSGVAFGTQPKVHDQDKFGNIRTGDSILLMITPGTGPIGASVTCATNPQATTGSGDAQFAGCSVDKANNGYRLRANTGISVVDSATFNVVPGPADHLIFQTYPSTPSGALLAPQPSVAVVDLGGNVIVGDSRAITLAINKNAGTFTCSGGLTKNAVTGVATFGGCTESLVATGYQLMATAAGLPVAVGGTFDITSGLPSNLLICWGPTLPCAITPPATVLGGTPFSAQPTVRITDSNGNQIPNDNTTIVSLAIASGTPTSGGPGTLTCSGGLSRAVSNGIATFSGCSIDAIGTAYRLIASSAPAYISSTTSPFNVTVGSPVKLVFVTQPSSTTANTAFPTNPTVAIVDAGNNVVTTGISATIALAIGTNPASGTLACTSGLQVATVNGVATFTGCTINNQGNGYTLTATPITVNPVTSLTSTTSVAFNVIAPAAAITITPSSRVITWAQTVVLSIHFGINGAGKSAQLQVAIDGVSWAPVINLTTDSNGNFTFDYRPATNLYYRVLFAGTPDLQAGLSNTTRVVVRQIALLRPTLSGSVRSISRGTTINFTTTVRPNRPGQLPPGNVRFVLFRLVGSHWTLSQTVRVTADSAGLARWSWTAAAGTWYVRTIADPNHFNANSVWSPVERYDVF